MTFDAAKYGRAAEILELGGGGERPMPLVSAGCWSQEARKRLEDAQPGALFPGARNAQAAVSGLYLYFGCFEASHSIAQDIPTPDGSYWHGILHRQEPDPGNAAYWFRRTGKHPVFATLASELQTWPASKDFDLSAVWDPFAFIDFCEFARRRSESSAEALAVKIQLLEWQLLFDYCAQPG